MAVRTTIRDYLYVTTILIGAFSPIVSTQAEPASAALPTGGQIVSGSGSISQTGNALNVQQNTQHMLTNWSSFNIGSDASMNFVQPNANSVAINRIAGGASEIFGALNANGKVVLVNPNGIIFGRSSQVNVGGLVASALDQVGGDGSGTLHLSGSGTGEVANYGNIQVPQGGVVALIAPRVINDGTIHASGGSVALAAGQGATIDFTGDGLITVAVDHAALDAAATNNGLIVADGGMAVMTAKSANALMGSVVNNSGTIQANTLVNKNGRIVLDGGDTGSVTAGGTIRANGTGTGQHGGDIAITGAHVAVADGARIAADGTAGGGKVRIGGGRHGQDSTIANAQSLAVASTAHVSANATENGHGGELVLWSDGLSEIGGALQAKGGVNGGNGGFIETSGATLALMPGLQVDTGAAGRGGLWLLDPTYSTIGTTEASAIETALLSGDVVNQSSGGTEIDASINGANGHNLSFWSAGRIYLNNITITTNGGDLYFGGATGGTSYATGQSSGSVGVLMSGTTLDAGAGSVTINGQGYNPSLLVAAGSVTANENAGEGILLTGTNSISGSSITLNGQGGDGQSVESTTGQTGTVSCSGDFTCGPYPADNGVNVSGGDGAAGISIGSSATLTATATSTIALNGQGGDGGDASFQTPNSGGHGAHGGSTTVGYDQASGSSVALNAPTSTITALVGSNGSGWGSGYYTTYYTSEFDYYDPDTGYHYLYGDKVSYDTNDSSSDGQLAMYVGGNLSNAASSSVLELKANGTGAYQGGGALTGVNVLMQGIGSDADFVFGQANNSITGQFAADLNSLWLNHTYGSGTPLRLGTVSGVSGITADDDVYLQAQSSGATASGAAIIQNAGATIAADNLYITADSLDLNGEANSVNVRYTAGIRPYSTGRDMVIGGTDSNPNNTLYIPTSSMDSFAAGIDDLLFGRSDSTGSLTITDNQTVGGNLGLSTGSGAITVNDDLTVGTNKTLTIYSTGTVNVDGKVTARNLSLNGVGGKFTFSDAANAISYLGSNGSTIGMVDLLNTGNLTIGGSGYGYYGDSSAWNNGFDHYADTSHLTATDRIYANTTDTMTVATDVQAQGSYTGAPNYTTATNMNQQQAASLLLVAGDNFYNTTGHGTALSVTGANNRYLVYSDTPNAQADLASSNDAFKMYAWEFYNSSQTTNGRNGFDYDAGGFGRSLPASSTGSGFLYKTQPTLTITPTAQSGTYGNTPSLSAAYTTGYTASGFIDGDTHSNVTMGTGVFTTTATSGSAIGTYDIAYSSNIAPTYNSVLLGYNVVNGTGTNEYTVNKRPITVTANSGQGMVYGDTVPSLTYAVTSGSLVNTGSNGALTGALTTDASSTSNVGSGYSILRGTVDNSNYLITYVGDNFSVTPRTLTVTPNIGQSKIMNQTDPVFTYAYGYTGDSGKTALVNGDSFTGQLGRDAGETVGQYELGIGSLTVNDGNGGNNYTLAVTPDVLFNVYPPFTPSSLTSAQVAITGTGVATALANSNAAQSVGPGRGSSSIADTMNSSLVIDTTALPPITGAFTLTSADGSAAPISITRSGATVSISLGVSDSPNIGNPALPLFVAGQQGGTTYHMADGGAQVSATPVTPHQQMAPTYGAYANQPVPVTLALPNGGSVPMSVGISTNGVLVIELPESAMGSIDPQTALALAWAAAKQQFGDSISQVTSAVIAPASGSTGALSV